MAMMEGCWYLAGGVGGEMLSSVIARAEPRMTQSIRTARTSGDSKETRR